MPEKVVKADQLEKKYQRGTEEVHAVDNISLEIESGENVAIMGPSGSGKSTLLMLLGGLEDPTSGKAYIKDESIEDLDRENLSELRRNTLSLVFQQDHLMPTLSLRENVALPISLTGQDYEEADEHACELLESVGLEDKFDALPGELSGGQRQRASIARALANDPELILADEPTGSLDTDTAEKIMELLCEESDKHNTAIVMVTHDSRMAEYMEHTIHIEDGKLKGGKQ